MCPENDTDGPSLSRRAALQTGALTAAALALRLPTVGATTATQEDEQLARVYAHDFYPGAEFQVVSDAIDYKPETPVQEGEAFLADLYWSDYETRIVRYENTNERVLFFAPESADVERGQTYQTGEIQSTHELADGVVGVTFD